MKKLSFLLLCLLIFVSGFSQKEIISLSFNAKDSITQNPLVLDSVYINNITLGCDTSLYNPVSDLSINILNVGIDEPASPFSDSYIVLQNVPNPFPGSTLVRIYLKTDRELNLAVYDVKGNQLSEYHNRFVKGWHLFGVSTSGSQLLFLKVSDNTYKKTIKLLSTGAGTEGSRISYNGHAGQDYPILKSVQEETGFIFYLGNQLQFTAYADGYYESILTGNPESDETYTFAMLPVEILPTVTTAPVTNIAQTTVTSGGNVTSDGGATVTARGVCWSTSLNPTITSSHTTNGSGTGAFVSNLTALTPNTPYYIRAYATNSVGTAYGNQVNFTTSPVSTCGSALTINHVAEDVAPVDKTVTYGTVTNIPGEPSKCWITSNLGADHQATSKSDATEASAGWYWQFNRKQGFKHDGVTRTPNTTWITSINENSSWTAANDPCTTELGAGWRIPTNTEWTNVETSGNWTNWNGPWNSGLKMHAAGFLDNEGLLYNRGSYGNYWSSAQQDVYSGWMLYFHSGNSNIGDNSKAFGYSVRCIKD